MNRWCYCCFINIPEGDAQPATFTQHIGGSTVITHMSVCTACRRLGCDVPNPDGCKRPEVVRERARQLAAGGS